MVNRGDGDASDVLGRAVAGDLQAMTAVQGISHDELVQAAAPGLVVTRGAVVRVLRQLQAAGDAEAAAQRWASLMLRGYLDPGQAPVVPATIDIDDDGEEAIVEALNRIADLGDAVDGHIDAEEYDELVSRLQRTADGT
jgi:hypothetical protein